MPVLGRPLDDDIVQTAGRLAAEENEDMGEGGAVIEALWVFEVPLSLPLDARIPEERAQAARAGRWRAPRRWGRSTRASRSPPRSVRARRAGEAIVHEAKRRGVEAIVLAAEEPALTRGGMVLGGRAGMRDTFVGETTRYVVNKAPCRVILTAAPPRRRRGAAAAGRRGAAPGGDPAPPDGGDGEPPRSPVGR